MLATEESGKNLLSFDSESEAGSEVDSDRETDMDSGDESLNEVEDDDDYDGDDQEFPDGFRDEVKAALGDAAVATDVVSVSHI